MTTIENSNKHGMVVVAHADDAEWGCSGTVAKLCHEGWEIVYVLCTDGSKGIDDPSENRNRPTPARYWGSTTWFFWATKTPCCNPPWTCAEISPSKSAATGRTC